MRKILTAIAAVFVLIVGAITVPNIVSAQPGTIYGCVSSTHTLTHVSVTSPLACPSQRPVSWPGDVGSPPSPSPSPTTASPSPSPTTPSPSPTQTGSACVTSATDGSCGPYQDAQIANSNGYNTYVNNDVWNAAPAFKSQTLTASSAHSWSVAAVAANGNTSVLSYPDTQQLFTRTDNTPEPLTDFSALNTSYSEAMNPNSGSDVEAGYDIWLNGYKNEIMIWTDSVNRGVCGGGTVVESSVTFGGQDYRLCTFGSSEIIYQALSNTQSGSLDALPFLTHLEGNGMIPASSGLSDFEYGFEVCSTGGQSEEFDLNGYTLTAPPA